MSCLYVPSVTPTQVLCQQNHVARRTRMHVASRFYLKPLPKQKVRILTVVATTAPNITPNITPADTHCRCCRPAPVRWPGRLTINSIVSFVAYDFVISNEDLISAKRKQRYCEPRQIVMYLARDLIQHNGLPMSYPQIADRLGGRDHTTAMHGVAKITHRVAHEPEYAARVGAIRQKLAR